MAERLIPGVGYISDVFSGERLIPGIGFVEGAPGATDATALGGTGTGYGSGGGGGASGDASATAPGGTGTGSGAGSGGEASTAPAIVIRDDYERSSVKLSGSSVTGSGDDAVIIIEPRVTESEILSSETRWGNPSARIDGVNGIRPTFTFSRYFQGNGGYHGGEVWGAPQRCFFSYDRIAWVPFDTTTASTVTDTVTFRHNTAFTQDTVYVGKTRQISPRQQGDWIAQLASDHAGVVIPAASALAYTPSGNVSTYPAQSFIADEFSAQTNELGATVPVTPLYAFEVNDASLMPLDGLPKRIAVVLSGVHASEDTANFALHGFVTAFLGSSSDAQALRRQYRLLVYPMLNAPGRIGGHFRGSFTNGPGGKDDLNRHFSESTSGLEIVDKPKAAILTDLGGAHADWMIDFHTVYSTGARVGAYTGATLPDMFKTRLATNTGWTVADLGSIGGVDSTDAWFAANGTTLAVTLEILDGYTPLTDAQIVTLSDSSVVTLQSMVDDGYIILDAIAPGGTGTGAGTGSGGEATGQTNATASGGTGTGSGSGTGGTATGEVGGSATAPGGTGTGTGSGIGGNAAGQVSATAPGGTGTGTGAGTGGTATGGTADAVASGGTGTGTGSGSGGSAGSQAYVSAPTGSVDYRRIRRPSTSGYRSPALN